MALGSIVTVVPLYQSEVSPTSIRGFLVGMHGVMICVGYTMASWVGLGFYFVQGTNSQWRGPLAIQVLAPLILCLGVFWLPESPRWRKFETNRVAAIYWKTRFANFGQSLCEIIASVLTPNSGGFTLTLPIVLRSISLRRSSYFCVPRLLKRSSTKFL